MENLQEEKQRRKEAERSMARWRFEEETRKREMFENAYKEKTLEDIDYDYQASMIMDLVKGWIDKIDPEARPKQHKELMAIWQGALTMMLYKETQGRRMGMAVVQLKYIEGQNVRLLRTNMEQLEEIERLNQIIQFMERNG